MSDKMSDMNEEVVLGQEDSPELVASVEERLAKTFDDAETTPTVESTVPITPTRPDTEPLVPAQPQQQKLILPDTLPAPITTDDQAVSDESTLDPAYRRAAKHQDWNDEEINAFYDAQPELAEKTFAKIHESTNKLSSQWSGLGRKIDEQFAPLPDSPPTPANQVVEPLLDVAKLLEDNPGDEAMINGIVKPLIQRLETIGTTPAPVQNLVDPNTLKAQALTRQTTQLFFKDPQIQSQHNKYYGDDMGDDQWGSLTIDQRDNRMRMLVLADAISAGAYAQQQELTQQEAMSFAHLSLTADTVKQSTRQEIKDSLQKRSSNLSLQSTSKTASEATALTSEQKDQKLVETTQQRLDNIKW